MRIALIRRLEVITDRQAFALNREDMEYFGELLNEWQTCFEEIHSYNKENNSPLSEEEKELLERTLKQDLRNRALFNEQFDEVKLKLRNIRMSENQSTQYMNSYGSWQESGVFFDKRGR